MLRAIVVRAAHHAAMTAPTSTAFADRFALPDGHWRRRALVLVFLWFFIGGVAHFTATTLEMRIVPPSIPWPRAAVLVSGALELIGAAGLVWPRTRRAAGVLLFLITIAVTPANVYMLQHAELFQVPRWVLVGRLPLQVALLWLIAWSTWPRVPAASASGADRLKPGVRRVSPPS